MNREQTVTFNKKYKELFDLGDVKEYGASWGHFEELGGVLANLAVGIDDDDNQLEFYQLKNSGFLTLIYTIPLDGKTKSITKKVVEHLMTKNFSTLEF